MADFNNISVRDFNFICRFCLKKDEQLKPIFKVENNGGGSGNDGGIVDFFNVTNDFAAGAIVQMVSLCIGLETKSNDGLPMFICQQCFDKLTSSHSFRRQCISSVEFLKKIRSGIKSEAKSTAYDDNEIGHDYADDTFADDLNDEIKEESDAADDRMLDISVEPLCLIDDSKPKQKTPQKSKKRKTSSGSSDEDFQPPSLALDDHGGGGGDSLDDDDDLPISRSVKAKKTPATKSTKAAKVPKAAKPPKAAKVPKVKKEPKVKREPKEKQPKANKTEQCEVCGFISRSLKSHMLTHTQEKNYECDFCGKKFSLRASLKNHLFAHINIRPFKCNLCPAEYIDKAVYRRHHDKHTRMNYKFNCEQCGRQFRRRYCFDKHVLTHTQIRRHACNYCQQMFLTADGLRNHEGIHTGERRYKCGLCPMAYNFNSSSSAHRRQHMVGGVFQCEKCNYSIRNFGTFKAHLIMCQPDRLLLG